MATRPPSLANYPEEFFALRRLFPVIAGKSLPNHKSLRDSRE
jgi:hypothetical protein